MRTGFLRGSATRTVSIALLVSLTLGTIPAFAEPTASVTATTTPEPPAPKPAPQPPGGGSTPAPSPSTPPPSPSPSTPAPDSGTRRAPEDPSALPVPEDEQTREFREELARRQARLDEFMAQLDELDRELALAAEAYNEAVDRLRATEKRLELSEEDLEKAKQAFDIQNELLEARAKTIYRGGGTGFAAIEVLLASKSVGDFFARLRFLNQIGVKDAEVAAMLQAQKDQIEAYTRDLKDAETLAQALEFDLKARQLEIMMRIQERQEMLAGAQADLLELLDAEAARRQLADIALLQQILASAEKMGVDVSPGSPVETALAYHGVPYLWGGETPAGFDCSGLILYVFRQHGVTLPHYSGSQFALGTPVLPTDLHANDVVFFGNPIHHVGLYIGGGYFLHAPRTGDFVKVSRLAERLDYAGARRYAWQPRLGAPIGISQIPANANHTTGVQLTP
ncbi:MAG: C40 family peptidase [Coriobacteriia bacterium]|nr:C40 family peptidase [Coriobacteriia bacterium]